MTSTRTREDEIVAVPPQQVITYLEMKSPEQFIPSYLSQDEVFKNDVYVKRLRTADVEFYRFLYSSIGERWRWRSRLALPKEELHQLLSNPDTTIDVLYYQGAPAGFFELRKNAIDESKALPEDTRNNTILLEYFGIRPPYLGRGLGKHLLSCAVQYAWDQNPSRVWVTTDNMDHPHAIPNYLSRGFEIYTEQVKPVPELYRD